jgi:hypothetical protein
MWRRNCRREFWGFGRDSILNSLVNLHYCLLSSSFFRACFCLCNSFFPPRSIFPLFLRFRSPFSGSIPHAFCFEHFCSLLPFMCHFYSVYAPPSLPHQYSTTFWFVSSLAQLPKLNRYSRLPLCCLSLLMMIPVSTVSLGKTKRDA